MADTTHTQTKPHTAPSGNDKTNPTSQTGQPNEMPDRGKSDGSQNDANRGDRFDRKPTEASGADAMKNEGGAPSSSTMQNKGMGGHDKGSAERKTPETERR